MPCQISKAFETESCGCGFCQWEKAGFEMKVRLKDGGVLFQVYNLGTGHGYSVLDMVKAFEKASGKKVS